MANKIETEIEFDLVLGARAVKKIVKESEETGEESGKAFKKGAKKGTKGLKGALAGAFKRSLKELPNIIRNAAVAFTGFGVLAAREAVKLENALIGLNSVAANTGASVSKIQEEAQRLASDGLIPLNDVTDSLKNLLVNFNGDVEKSVKVFEAFRDSAAFNRQGQLELGEAIRGASEGLKNDLSIKIDNAGVTKNLSNIQKEYAASIGKTIGSLTQAEKAQAEYVGIIKEAGVFQGDYNKLLDTFSGALSKVSGSFKFLLAAIGKLITENPAAIKLVDDLAEAFKGATLFIDDFRRSTEEVSKTNIDKKIEDAKLAVIDLEQELIKANKEIKGLTKLDDVFTLKRETLTAYVKSSEVRLAQLRKEEQALIDLRESQKFTGPPEPPAGPTIDPETQNRLTSQLGQIGLTQEQILRENLAKQEAILRQSLENRVITRQQFAERSLVVQQQFNDSLAQLKAQETQLAEATTFDKVTAAFKSQANTIKVTAGEVASTVRSSFVNGFSQAFAAFGSALATGENAFKDFGKSILKTIGGLAIQLGSFFILIGAGLSSTTQLLGLSGGGAIAAGVALTVLGGALQGLAGGGGSAGSTAGAEAGSTGSSFSGPESTEFVEDEEREEQQASVNVVIQGDVLDSDESGLRIAQVLNDAFDKQGVTIRGGLVGA